jgi:hypothetical protein
MGCPPDAPKFARHLVKLLNGLCPETDRGARRWRMEHRTDLRADGGAGANGEVPGKGEAGRRLIGAYRALDRTLDVNRRR